MMNERQIQFTLLENPKELSNILGINANVIAAYLDLKPWGGIGQIDFVMEDTSGNAYVVELEREINNKAKVEHVVEQVHRYACISQKVYQKLAPMVVLAAQSDPRYLDAISDRLHALHVQHKIINYDLSRIKRLYNSILDYNQLMFGLSPEEVKSVAVASLKQLNGIFAYFKTKRTTEMTLQQMGEACLWKHFSTLMQRLKYCQELGLLSINNETVFLTKQGGKYTYYTNIPYRIGKDYIDLNDMQKALIRQNLIRHLRIEDEFNSIIKKIIIYIQFIILVQGSYKRADPGVISLYRQLVRRFVSLRDETISNIIYWSHNYAINLDLIREDVENNNFRVTLTPAGTQFYRMSCDILNLRREEKMILTANL